MTGALRADGASTFGNDYKAAIYPKAGVSWVVSEEPMFPYLPWLDNLRLRYAFGAIGSSRGRTCSATPSARGRRSSTVRR